jgi:LmbE family N-acetylglucosaminyl deacetylase
LAYRLLCVTAHPDDESGGFAGALLTAHARGAETTVLCLTEGQAATNRGETRSGAELAAVRRAEFAAACEVLKVTHREVLHYPDGELWRENFYELVGLLVRRIRAARPQVVMTFGGEGSVNLHRDHTMVSVMTTAAFHWAGRSFASSEEQCAEGLKPYGPQKLHYSCPPFLMTRRPEDEARATRIPYSLELKLGPLKETKFQAFSQHTSQLEVMKRARDIFEHLLEVELYLLAASRIEQPAAADKDLFEGVVED